MKTYEEEIWELLKENSHLHLISGLAAECGEVAGLFQKAMYKGTTVSSKLLFEELGDVLFYVAALAYQNGCSLEDLKQINLDKLRKRHALSK